MEKNIKGEKMKFWKELKVRINAIVWFYKMCHNQKFIFLHGGGIWEKFSENIDEVFTKEAIFDLMTRGYKEE